MKRFARRALAVFVIAELVVGVLFLVSEASPAWGSYLAYTMCTALVLPLLDLIGREIVYQVRMLRWRIRQARSAS